MEFVEGQRLRSLLERSGKLPVEQAPSLAKQLAAGLSEAHRQSIAHRDPEPENIMLTPRNELKMMASGFRGRSPVPTSTMARGFARRWKSWGTSRGVA